MCHSMTAPSRGFEPRVGPKTAPTADREHETWEELLGGSGNFFARRVPDPRRGSPFRWHKGCDGATPQEVPCE